MYLIKPSVREMFMKIHSNFGCQTSQMSAGNLKPSVAIFAEANLSSDPGLTSMVTVKWLRSFWISCREVDNR